MDFYSSESILCPVKIALRVTLHGLLDVTIVPIGLLTSPSEVPLPFRTDPELRA